MAIEVITTEYEFSHGKKPRGEGCWAFEINDRIFWPAPYQAYGEAVKDAKREAKARDCDIISVCP